MFCVVLVDFVWFGLICSYLGLPGLQKEFRSGVFGTEKSRFFLVKRHRDLCRMDSSQREVFESRGNE